MRFQKPKISISPSLPLLLICMLLLDKTDIGGLAVILSAAAIHELGHLAAAGALKIPLKRITIDIFGALIEVDDSRCAYSHEAILSLSGPIFNLISALIALYLHMGTDVRLFVVSSFFFAIINLLPIRGFDGGRALACILLTRLPLRWASGIISLLSFFCLVILWSISVYFIMRTASYLSLFIFSSALFAKAFIVRDV